MYVLTYGGPVKDGKPVVSKVNMTVSVVSQLPPTINYDGKTFVISPDVLNTVDQYGYYGWKDPADDWGINITKVGTWVWNLE